MGRANREQQILQDALAALQTNLDLEAEGLAVSRDQAAPTA